MILDANNIDTQSLSISTDILKGSTILKKPLPNFKKNMETNKTSKTDSNDISSILNDIDNVVKDYDGSNFVEIDNNKQKEFETVVKKWIELDDKLIILNKELSALNSEKRKCEKSIKLFMTSNNLQDLETSKGTIKCNKLDKPQALTDKKLKDILVMYFSDTHQATNLHTYLKNHLGQKEIVKLELIKE